jgi:phosphoribosylformylglycinamidine synthase PurS subunit
MKISVIITLKKDVLDPQGKVIHQTLDGMGFQDINEVRQGKYFEIDTKETDNDKAKAKVEEMCKKLLANLVIENYKIIDQLLLFQVQIVTETWMLL